MRRISYLEVLKKITLAVSFSTNDEGGGGTLDKNYMLLGASFLQIFFSSKPLRHYKDIMANWK